MKRIFLLLLLTASLFATAQPGKKQLFYHLLQQNGGGAPASNIVSVTYDVDTIHYTNEAIELTATPDVATTNSSWRIIDENGVLQGLAFGNSVSITTVTTPGFYTIVYEALTATDRIVHTWNDILVLAPRFTRAEADIIIGAQYYNDFASADNSGLKIWVENNWTGYLIALNLHGTVGNPVRVQVEDDGIVQTGSSGFDGIVFSGARHVVINGYRSNKTKGWRLNMPMNTNFGFRCENTAGVTNLIIAGIEIIYTGANTDRSAISIIPPVNASYNATNFVNENSAVYNCYISGPQAEGIYAFYTNDTPQGGFEPYNGMNFRIVYNKVLNTGRDGIQFSSCNYIRVHSNYINNIGTGNNSSHENGISCNEGNSGWIYGNYIINANMGINAKSGITPFEDGESVPLDLWVTNNVFIRGTPSGTPTAEPYFNYFQTNNGTGETYEWPVHFDQNIIFTATQTAVAFAVSTGHFTMDEVDFRNNVIVKTGSEYTLLGTNQPSSPNVNNLVRNYSSYADLNFTSSTNLRPTSLSSPQFTGATDLSGSGQVQLDADGYPLLANSYVHGAYNLYNQQVIAPTIADTNPATITTPVAVDPSNNGGEVSFDANKEGILYYVVVANGAGAPTIADVKAGTGLASGQVLDGGTAGTDTFTGLSPSTAYDLYYVFTTKYWVDQASVTKVDFTTDADVVAPTLSGWNIPNANPNRLYFNSSEIITASTYSGFTIDQIIGTAVTVTGVTINAGQTTGHYFTLSENVEAIDYLARIAYSGSGSNLQDASGNPLAAISATTITNNITTTRIQVNMTNYGVNGMGSGWNDIQMDGNLGVRTLDSDLVDNANASTGYSLAIYDNFDAENNSTNATGIYITGAAGIRGIQHYAGTTGGLRLAGLSGKSGNIVYITKGLTGTVAGNININGAGAVSFTNATTEFKQSWTANGSGYVDILLTITSAGGSSVGITGFIVTVNP